MGIRIVLIDDHEIIRQGLTALLAGTVIEVVGEAGRGADALEVVDSNQPEIVLLDVRLLDVNGLTVLGLLRRERPTVKVLMLSSFDAPAYVAWAVVFGASGFLTKTISREELIAAIERVASGATLWTAEQLRRVNGALSVPDANDELAAALTAREAEVLSHLAEGRSNKEIARILELSCDTVKEHVQHLLRKLGVADRTQAAIWAVRKRLV